MLAAGAGRVACFLLLLFCFFSCCCFLFVCLFVCLFCFLLLCCFLFFFFCCCFVYVVVVFISSILSPFSNASSLGRRLDKLKCCGLGRYNPPVVVSYYWRCAR